MTREEILREFKGVEGINEAKKIYKTLAKKNGITISNLVLQLVEAGYKQFTKNDL